MTATAARRFSSRGLCRSFAHLRHLSRVSARCRMCDLWRTVSAARSAGWVRLSLGGYFFGNIPWVKQQFHGGHYGDHCHFADSGSYCVHQAKNQKPRGGRHGLIVARSRKYLLFYIIGNAGPIVGSERRCGQTRGIIKIAFCGNIRPCITDGCRIFYRRAFDYYHPILYCGRSRNKFLISAGDSKAFEFAAPGNKTAIDVCKRKMNLARVQLSCFYT